MNVGYDELYAVAAYIGSGEIYRGVGQAENIRATSSVGFRFFALLHDYILQDEFIDQLGDCGNAYVKFLREFGQSGLPVYRHVGNYVSLNQIVLVGYAPF
ncbi:MAG: hypothetical protein L6V35_09105 [Alistipes putredinis]|nr:MAG: hypothetical protein L6V35_09105 [Alistipes putredinis]